MSEYYMINDVARLFRISKETVRFYEKKHIITPKRDDENAYRYYTLKDIRRLYDCRIYQNIGFTLEEVVQIFNEASEEKLDEMLLNKEVELRKLMENNQRALDRIEQISEAREKVELYCGKFYIRDSPHCLFSVYSDQVLSDREALNHEFWDCVANSYNLFNCTAVISSEIACDPEFDKKMKTGFSINNDAAMGLDLEPDKYVVEFKSRRSVYTAFRAEPIANYAALEPALRWIEKRNLRLSGDIICRAKKVSFDHGVDSRFYEAWLPIEEN